MESLLEIEALFVFVYYEAADYLNACDTNSIQRKIYDFIYQQRYSLWIDSFTGVLYATSYMSYSQDSALHDETFGKLKGIAIFDAEKQLQDRGVYLFLLMTGQYLLGGWDRCILFF